MRRHFVLVMAVLLVAEPLAAQIAVHDIDSSVKGAFDEEDRVGLERLMEWFARRDAVVRA